MAKYLVTGGAGFIGSHLVEALLQQGHAVRVLDDLSTGKRSNVPANAELVVGDVANEALTRPAMADVDGCFHLAAIASVQRGNEDWLGTHRANQTGAITVFDAARPGGARGTRQAAPVVYASSAAVFGDNPNVPLSEAATLKPLTAYGADKLGCELHARVASHVHGVPTIGFRFFNVYGPRQDPKSPYSGVIAIFADRISAGQGITINGDGGQVRDFIYVGDVVKHLLAGMAKIGPGAEVFNVCTGRATTINELAAAIADVTGKPLNKSHGPERPGDIRISIGDASRAVARLGVKAETTLRQGLVPTLG